MVVWGGKTRKSFSFSSQSFCSFGECFVLAGKLMFLFCSEKECLAFAVRKDGIPSSYKECIAFAVRKDKFSFAVKKNDLLFLLERVNVFLLQLKNI